MSDYFRGSELKSLDFQMERDWIVIQSGLTVGLRMAVEHLNKIQEIFCRHPGNNSMRWALIKAADLLMREVMDLKVDLLVLETNLATVFQKQTILRDKN
jgi:hypothetical protein